MYSCQTCGCAHDDHIDQNMTPANLNTMMQFLKFTLFCALVWVISIRFPSHTLNHVDHQYQHYYAYVSMHNLALTITSPQCSRWLCVWIGRHASLSRHDKAVVALLHLGMYAHASFNATHPVSTCRSSIQMLRSHLQVNTSRYMCLLPLLYR